MKRILFLFGLAMLCACGGSGGSDSSESFSDLTPAQEDIDMIPDFSGRWVGKLALRHNDCNLGNLSASDNFVMDVEQSGTAIKVLHGGMITKGDVNAERDGFFSQASGKNSYGRLWKLTHRLRPDDNGNGYVMQYSYTFETTDGVTDFNCNYKYLGNVVRQ